LLPVTATNANSLTHSPKVPNHNGVLFQANPLGTTARDILSLLREFYDNSCTAKVTSIREVLQERCHHRSSFEVLAMTSFKTLNRKKSEKGE